MSAEILQSVLEQSSLDAQAGMRAHLDSHLTDEQFCEMVTLSAVDADAHPQLKACVECRAELSTMRRSLKRFRDATRAYADDELRRLPQIPLPARGIISPAMKPAWWLTAAALMFAALAPMQMQHMRVSDESAGITGSVVVSDTQSDEALLEDVDRDASASLPAPLEALANPATSMDVVPTSTAAQRKD